MRIESNLFAWVAALACLALAGGCATSGKPGQSTEVPEIRPGILAGYLQSKDIPNGLALIPPPPAANSAAFAYDQEVSQKSFTLRGTPRWALAVEDANSIFPRAAGTFSCALNAPVTEQDTPRLYTLIRRAFTDAGLSIFPAKRQYNRTRPFAVNKSPICTPNQERFLAMDGSYPSGQAAVGWALALILSEIAPEQADAILARGLAFGESRVVCNVHWQSDVVAGRLLGAAVVARLHADPAFRDDLEAAKAELSVVRAKGLKPLRDCPAEAAALAK